MVGGPFGLGTLAFGVAWRHRGEEVATRTSDFKETNPHSAGWEEVGWGGSGNVARGRQTLRNVCALSMPSCTEKLSWQRRP